MGYGTNPKQTIMTQPKTLTLIQKLREKHQALAEASARSGVIPDPFSDDPAFLNLMASFKTKPLQANERSLFQERETFDLSEIFSLKEPLEE